MWQKMGGGVGWHLFQGLALFYLATPPKEREGESEIVLHAYHLKVSKQA